MENLEFWGILGKRESDTRELLREQINNLQISGTSGKGKRAQGKSQCILLERICLGFRTSSGEICP